jgi:type I restriction enzyme, S subunit
MSGQKVAKGYKQTEVGVIPEDWDVVCIDTLVKDGPKNGYSGRSGKDSRGTPTLSLSATSTGYLLLNQDTIKFLEETIPSDSDLFLRANDILVQRSNTVDLVGTTAIFDGTPKSYIYPDLMMRLRFRECTTARWFWKYANSAEGRKFFVSVAAGSSGSMPKISGNQLRKMPLPLPPIAEQKQIARALSDIDALIEGLEGAIGKKRQIKQGAMQELLRSKDDWVEVRLGDIATLINGRAYAIHEWETSGTPVIRLQNLTGRGENYYYSNLSLPEKHYCNNGDLLFMWSATFGPIIWNGARAIYHYHIWKVECHVNQLDQAFFYHVLSDITEKLKRSSSSGGTMLHLTKWGMEKMAMKIPSYDQQQAIATILSDMDSAISTLEAKLIKTRQLKQGMMHELLTGRIRLV